MRSRTQKDRATLNATGATTSLCISLTTLKVPSIHGIVVAHVYRDDLLIFNQKLKGDSIGKVD